jgi:large subunit ribosomal protein L7/L12
MMCGCVFRLLQKAMGLEGIQIGMGGGGGGAAPAAAAPAAAAKRQSTRRWRCAEWGLVATPDTALPSPAADAPRFSRFSLFVVVIPAAEAAKPAEVQTAFSVRLDSFDAKDKIKVIKEVRTATGLGLKESKDLVEGAPKVIKKDLSKADADALVAKLKEAGAKCSLE